MKHSLGGKKKDIEAWQREARGWFEAAGFAIDDSNPEQWVVSRGGMRGTWASGGIGHIEGDSRTFYRPQIRAFIALFAPAPDESVPAKAARKR